MSLNRWAKRRDSNELEIIDEFERLGFSVCRIDTPLDLIVGKNDRNYLVEVKTASGRLTKDQQQFIRDWQGQFAVVRTVEEVRILARLWYNKSTDQPIGAKDDAKPNR